jgi:hypothetical protein
LTEYVRPVRELDLSSLRGSMSTVKLRALVSVVLASLFHAGSGHVRSGVPSVTRASGGRVVRAHLAAGAREVRDLSVAA